MTGSSIECSRCGQDFTPPNKRFKTCESCRPAVWVKSPCRGCGGDKGSGKGRTYCVSCSISCPSHSSYTTKCTECVSLYNKAATTAIKDDPELLRRRNRQRKASRYDITMDQVVEAENTEVCKICGDTASMVIDHCHETGEYRGAICGYCNVALGQVRDNVQTLKNMIAYLEGNL